MPTCPDCVLAARRIAEPKPKPAAPVPAAASGAPERPVDAAVVEGRDAAILGELKMGPRTFTQLLEVARLREPHLNETERRGALSRTLSRLRMKTREVVERGNDLWELVS